MLVGNNACNNEWINRKVSENYLAEKACSNAEAIVLLGINSCFAAFICFLLESYLALLSIFLNLTDYLHVGVKMW